MSAREVLEVLRDTHSRKLVAFHVGLLALALGSFLSVERFEIYRDGLIGLFGILAGANAGEWLAKRGKKATGAVPPT